MDLNKWYTIKVQTNHEKKVADRIRSEKLRNENLINEVLVPTERKYFLKNGKKYHRETITFPGYIFISSSHPSELSQLLKQVPGTTGLLKNKSGDYQILKQIEVDKIVGDMSKSIETADNPYYIIGEQVKINSGPFGGFKGSIEELNMEKQKVKVSVLIFGRSTPVDLELIQIEKHYDA